MATFLQLGSGTQLFPRQGKDSRCSPELVPHGLLRQRQDGGCSPQLAFPIPRPKTIKTMIEKPPKSQIIHVACPIFQTAGLGCGQQYSAWLGSSLLGLGWAGSQPNTNDHLRSSLSSDIQLPEYSWRAGSSVSELTHHQEFVTLL